MVWRKLLISGIPVEQHQNFLEWLEARSAALCSLIEDFSCSHRCSLACTDLQLVLEQLSFCTNLRRLHLWIRVATSQLDLSPLTRLTNLQELSYRDYPAGWPAEPVQFPTAFCHLPALRCY
ncbi:hypothetical protein WJX72_011585 [[Myrmecia] bisecta]|uniref:Uncharacterized protein n=1 Tax=[Myrmecia] bisecta TaxID=41462 RepID=A0AAW1P9K2_9CHLO